MFKFINNINNKMQMYSGVSYQITYDRVPGKQEPGSSSSCFKMAAIWFVVRLYSEWGRMELLCVERRQHAS